MLDHPALIGEFQFQICDRNLLPVVRGHVMRNGMKGDLMARLVQAMKLENAQKRYSCSKCQGAADAKVPVGSLCSRAIRRTLLRPDIYHDSIDLRRPSGNTRN